MVLDSLRFDSFVALRTGDRTIISDCGPSSLNINLSICGGRPQEVGGQLTVDKPVDTKSLQLDAS